MLIPTIVRATTLVIVLAIPAGLARAEERNACGCTQTDSGTCVCERKARCGCPGLCEPEGCEAQREKAFQRELDSETRKARETDRQRAATKAEPTTQAAPELPPRPAAAMTTVQQKELVKLLDLYFAAHPGARAESAGDLRNEIRPSPARR